MTIPSEVPIDSPEAWRGVWIRGRGGPTMRGTVISVEPWHVVAHVGARIDTYCGRRALLWPSGGARLEVARPGAYGTVPPGEVCPRCRPGCRESEIEVAALTDDVMDDLASRVAARLLERMPK
jgi:hypothetical protein